VSQSGAVSAAGPGGVAPAQADDTVEERRVVGHVHGRSEQAGGTFLVGRSRNLLDEGTNRIERYHFLRVARLPSGAEVRRVARATLRTRARRFARRLRECKRQAAHMIEKVADRIRMTWARVGELVLADRAYEVNQPRAAGPRSIVVVIPRRTYQRP
jgi:hypothetical protein